MTREGEGWERDAANWIAWARAPGHDAYWTYGPLFFELLPPPGRAALEVGCGEGRVTRDLRGRGYSVTGLDASPTLAATAREADPGGEYVLGRAEELPFADASFDLAVFYNSLMDVADMPLAVTEAARVLEPGGRLCACVVHPLLDAGSWESSDDDVRLVIDGSYFESRDFEETLERDGLTITFRSRTYTLEAYVRALEDAGLLLEALREPVSPPGYRAEGRYSRLPMFLLFRALKPQSGA